MFGFLAQPAIQLLVLAVEGSADDEASHLWGSGADFIQFGVPEEPACRVVIDVAISSQDL